MRVFEKFPENKVCPICGTNENKPGVLIGIDGTEEGHIMEADCFHVDCLELRVSYQNENALPTIYQIFASKQMKKEE